MHAILALRGFRLKLCCTFGVDADEFAAAAFVFEFDKAFDQSEKRVVLAAADVVAWFPLCAALTRQYITAEYMLAAEFFESEPLSV